MQAVLLPLRFPALFTGLRSGPRNVLLHGEPGELRGLALQMLWRDGDPHCLASVPAARMQYRTKPSVSAGTGRATLGEKLAAEAGLPLLALTPSSLLSKWAGDSEKMLKKVTD